MSPSPTQSEDLLTASFQFGASPLATDGRRRPLRTFLFGYPIASSLAPLLHASLFHSVSLPWTFELLETPNDAGFLPALRQSDVIGCAITMPHKVNLMSAVDDVLEEARMSGAINTVFLRRDLVTGATRYIGSNTDTIGVREAFLRNCPGVQDQSRGRPALVVGGGGASRASIYALWKWLGASTIYLVSRLESEVLAIKEAFSEVGFQGTLVHVATLAEAETLEPPVLIVGAVPDYPPKEPGELLAREIVKTFLSRKPEKGYILEMCYFPKVHTSLCELGQNAGWQVIYGTHAMIWQGIAQQCLWAELPMEAFGTEEAQMVIDKAIQEREIL